MNNLSLQSQWVSGFLSGVATPETVTHAVEELASYQQKIEQMEAPKVNLLYKWTGQQKTREQPALDQFMEILRYLTKASDAELSRLPAAKELEPHVLRETAQTHLTHLIDLAQSYNELLTQGRTWLTYSSDAANITHRVSAEMFQTMADEAFLVLMGTIVAHETHASLV